MVLRLNCKTGISHTKTFYFHLVFLRIRGEAQTFIVGLDTGLEELRPSTR